MIDLPGVARGSSNLEDTVELRPELIKEDGFVNPMAKSIEIEARCSDAESGIHIVHVMVITMSSPRKVLITPRTLPNRVPMVFEYESPPIDAGIGNNIAVTDLSCLRTHGTLPSLCTPRLSHPKCTDWSHLYGTLARSPQCARTVQGSSTSVTCFYE